MKRMLLFLMLCGTVPAAPFECELMMTRQDASMDWWYAVPENFAPQISTVSAVTRGEYFRILPLFRKYKTDIGGAANITFDLRITRPDGTVRLELPKLEGHVGLALPHGLLPAQAVVNFCFEPEDAWGTYDVELAAVDHASASTNRLHRRIELQPFELEKMTKEEREALFLSYCTVPDPSRALAAFLQTEESFFTEGYEPVWSAVWFFKTVFENNDYLIPLMMERYGACAPKQQRDIILMAVLLGTTDQLPRLSTEMRRYRRLMEAGRIPDPYAEITTGKQLDMLWAEFFAAGTVKPLKQMVRSLSLAEHLGTLDKIEAGELDAEDEAVYRRGILESVFQAALWSLRSNCTKVPLVKQYCIGILETEVLEKQAATCLAMLLQSIEAQTPVKQEKEKSDERDHNNQ